MSKPLVYSLRVDQTWNFRYTKPPAPDGPLFELSQSEAERLLLDRLASSGGSDVGDALWELARLYSQTRRQDKAMDCLRQALELQVDPEAKAGCILAMGQTAEQIRDYESAIRYYKEAFAMEPAGTRTWYLIHNNLGYSLNTLGRFVEGETYCRQAIEIDGSRPNAYKNLGISLQGQGQLEEAARCFITATRVDAGDRRSSDLLDKLLRDHPDLGVVFAVKAECCRKAVDFAAQERAKEVPVVRRGLRTRLILLKLKVRTLLQRFRGS